MGSMKVDLNISTTLMTKEGKDKRVIQKLPGTHTPPLAVKVDMWTLGRAASFIALVSPLGQ